MKRSTRFTVGHGLAVLLLPLALLGCGGGGSTVDPTASPAQRVAQLEASGELPKLDRTATIAGIDANANGVRDDIEQYIEQKYTAPAQRAAAMQTARVYQRMLLVDKTDQAALDAVSELGSRAIVCASSVFTGPEESVAQSQMDMQLESMTSNTKLRLLAYLAYNKARSGTVSTMPKGDTCD